MRSRGDIAGALSVMAARCADVATTLRDYEKGDRDLSTDSAIVDELTLCMETIGEVSDAFRKAESFSILDGSRPDPPFGVQTYVRLKHLRQDLSKLKERLEGLLQGIELAQTPASAPDDRTSVLVGMAVSPAMAFAETELSLMQRRLAALARHYESPDTAIEDEADPGDLALREAFAHLDPERPGDRAHMAGAESESRRGESAFKSGETKPVRCTLVPVFYATDREPTRESSWLHLDYEDRLSDDSCLRYGVAEISIPRGKRHHIGRIERPSLWKLQFREDPDKHIVITQCEGKVLDQWRSLAVERLAIAGRKSALVFIHGFNVSFAEALRRAGQIGWDLNFEGLITAFSWSSGGAIKSYLTDERNARLAAPRLIEFFNVLRKELDVQDIHVIAHSMGNVVLLEALRELGMPAADSPTLAEVVLAAPDYDAEQFKQVMGKIQRQARRYTLYGSEGDRALKASKGLRSNYPRAGDGGPRVVVVKGVETIDASAVGEDLLGLGHSYFGSKRTVLTDLFYVIKESLPPNRRSGMQERNSGGQKYWLFAP